MGCLLCSLTLQVPKSTVLAGRSIGFREEYVSMNARSLARAICYKRAFLALLSTIYRCSRSNMGRTTGAYSIDISVIRADASPMLQFQPADNKRYTRTDKYPLHFLYDL